MKIPSRILGFIDNDGKKMPFEFDKDKFQLKFFYPTEKDAFEHLFDGISVISCDLKKHEWIPRIQFKGITAEGYGVLFGTTDNPTEYQGYRTYSVSWYYLACEDTEKIDELRFAGREIDYFFPPAKTFTQSIKFKESEPRAIDKMSVETVKVLDFDCGSYEYEGIETKIKCSAFPTMHTNADSPLDAKSYFYLEFFPGLDVEHSVEKIQTIRQFIKFISYRNNYRIDEIEAFVKNEEGKYSNCGCFVFLSEDAEESNEKAKKTIISAELLGVHTAGIIHAIDRNEMAFGHICKSVEDTSHYPISRMIMILSAFEREFRNIYGQDVRRSEEYSQVKEEVVEMLYQHAKEFQGKKKKYIAGFAKGIANTDSSYGDNLKFVFTDCKEIMEPFVIRRYEGSYEEIAEDVSYSINQLRNGVAHSRLDLELEARHLTDIKFVEELLYVMRLKKLGVEDTKIRKILNELFRENMAM